MNHWDRLLILHMTVTVPDLCTSYSCGPKTAPEDALPENVDIHMLGSVTGGADIVVSQSHLNTQLHLSSWTVYFASPTSPSALDNLQSVYTTKLDRLINQLLPTLMLVSYNLMALSCRFL